jgi:dephospho-CoA kinase
MLRVGLTGGIACGKSRVLAQFAARGLATLDLDRVAHEVVGPGGAAHRDILAAFGAEILDANGGVDRKALGRIVFRDGAARDRLNAIVHPRVREAESRWASGEAARGARIAVTDAALLVESGLHLRFDRLVVVHCSADEQLRRLMSRDGIDAEAARARISAQMPVGEKRRYAHVEIGTDGPTSETDRAALVAADELERAAAGAGPPLAIPLERGLGALVSGPPRGPRGLSPAPLLAAVASWGGLDLARAARLLVPPAPEPWYRQARGDGAEAPPASLAAPLVLWALTRGAPDDEYLASAAASLARLTHGEGTELADAVAVALALQEALVAGRAPAPGWSRGATVARWGRAPASERLEPDVASWLAGAARGVSEPEAPAEVLAAVRAIQPF